MFLNRDILFLFRFRESENITISKETVFLFLQLEYTFASKGTNFISVMPTNLYDPNDNFDLKKSHVLPAFIRKMNLGKLLVNYSVQGLLDDLSVDSYAFAKVELLKKESQKKTSRYGKQDLLNRNFMVP